MFVCVCPLIKAIRNIFFISYLLVYKFKVTIKLFDLIASKYFALVSGILIKMVTV